ncbi:MAG TPA: SDR family oxidoreductase [Sphingomonas sp.]|nr:SDR family oxidoreductase [Sphingomonas sp.]
MSFELKSLDPERIRKLRPDMLFGLEGKTAIVTGAGGGLGGWMAAGLAAAGANVLMTHHPTSSTAATADAIRAAGGTAREFACDLLADTAPAEIVREAMAQFGRVDILVNNAGTNRREPIFDVSRENWELIGDLNLRVPYELSREAAKIMSKNGGGSIIHIGSLTNAIGLDNVSVYGAYKAAVCNLAKSMAVEWARDHIRVNAICPGFMLTPLSKPLWEDPVRGKWLLQRSPMRRPGYPEELIGMCLMLASEAGSFITGQAMYVDGGWLAGTSWTQG